MIEPANTPITPAEPSETKKEIKKATSPSISNPTPKQDKPVVSNQQPKSSSYVTGSLIDITKRIISVHEGVRTHAYWDNGHWSIGYGTRSYAGEVITKEEALRRFTNEIQTRIDRVKKDYPTANNHQVAALTSLLYNCPGCYSRVGATVTRSDFNRPSLVGTRYEKGIKKRGDNELALYELGVIY